jgi:hypothetical protein
VGRSETGMNTTVSFIECVDDITAELQQFFVRTKRHDFSV